MWSIMSVLVSEYFNVCVYGVIFTYSAIPTGLKLSRVARYSN